MKYYVILLVTYTDGTDDKVGIYAHKTEAKAIKAFYSYMGQYTNGENVATINVEVKNNVGGIYKNETWTKKVEEPVVDGE